MESTQAGHHCPALLVPKPRGDSLITRGGTIAPDARQCGFPELDPFGIKKARVLGRGGPKELSDSQQPLPVTPQTQSPP